MRILFLPHRLPFPPHKGDKIRALNILRHLAKHHEVLLACPIDDPADLEHLATVRALTSELVYEPIRPALRKAAALFTALPRGRSITAACFHCKPLQQRVDALIGRERVDAVLCYSSCMAEYVFRSRQRAQLHAMPKVMDLIDVDSLKWRQYAERCPAWARPIYRYEASRLEQLEQRIAREFDRILVVSEQEARHFPQDVARAKLAPMGNGVDLEFFAPRAPARPHATPRLVFSGVMDYWPNIEGITWFAEKVLPLVQQEVPGTELCIVGNRPAPAVRRLAHRPGVVVTGYVEDMRDYVASAAVCIAPLRIARGIQNKVLEAMAMARPVVASTQAHEGLVARPGRDLEVADDAAAFAAATVELLRNPGRAAALGQCARACVERHYAWGEQLRLLDEIFPPDQSIQAGKLVSARK
ncbi:MAG TPA: TIGR03087 family PEP-CTERM/XrtA system glycosyltransferase [Steroidobacteraceae bacterium]|nr:TIGR03087 family PEP-CTERM/XrtA system glycosyltransferase [Steroidobacteraceae bacterium]